MLKDVSGGGAAGMAILLVGALLNLVSVPSAIAGKHVYLWISLAALLAAIVGTAVAGNAVSDVIAAAEAAAAAAAALGQSTNTGAGPGRGVAIAGVIFTAATAAFGYVQRRGEGSGGK
jgi:hypothetical protein